MVDYIPKIIFLYINETWLALKLNSNYPALMLFDMPHKEVQKLLDENDILYIVAPASQLHKQAATTWSRCKQAS